MNNHAITQTQDVTESAFELFADHLERFRRHLIDQHHAEHTVRKYIRCIGVLAETMKAQRIALEDLDEVQASALVAKTGWIGRRRTYAAFMVRRFVRFLSEHGVGKSSLPIVSGCSGVLPADSQSRYPFHADALASGGTMVRFSKSKTPPMFRI